MTRTTPPFRSAAIALSMLLLLVSACASDGSAAPEVSYEQLSTPTLSPGDEVPAPLGEVVLTIGGDISNTNVGDTLQFDMETLESLGLIQYSVDDYQAEGRVVAFSGVLASSVLEVAGASSRATSLRTVALNDYAVEIPVEDVNEYPVIIATAVDGNRMSVEAYGPTRVIYPSSDYDLDAAVYDPRWIWQLALIEVR